MQQLIWCLHGSMRKDTPSTKKGQIMGAIIFFGCKIVRKPRMDSCI
jgi:hypothetical protein